LNAHDTRLLLSHARTAKEQLTEHMQTQITAVLSGGELVDMTLTREAFYEMTQNLVQRTLQATRRACAMPS